MLCCNAKIYQVHWNEWFECERERIDKIRNWVDAMVCWLWGVTCNVMLMNNDMMVNGDGGTGPAGGI
jgi:hypothetical protein